MKKTLLLLTLIISLFIIDANAQRIGIIMVNARFSGILDGYDLMNKTVVYVDGSIAGETTEQLQSKPNSCSITVPRGKHRLRIVNMAKNDGRWEEHTFANNYSIDALYENKVRLRKKQTINLVFDITREKTSANLN